MRVLGVTDSPKVHTGFGTVSYQIYDGLYKEFELFVVGLQDWEWDNNSLPYTFYPVEIDDRLGFMNMERYVRTVRPDVIWLMIDPGNALVYYRMFRDIGDKMGYHPKIVAYLPIEGFPIPYKHIQVIKSIEEHGKVVLWCKSGVDRVFEQTGIKLDYIYFGSDHANFRKIDVSAIRKSLKLDNVFLCGSVGVNKRTKGFDKLIYAASELKKKGHTDIKFYCHTEPDYPTMQGFFLRELAYVYEVEDMFIWKPHKDRDNIYQGVEREIDSLYSMEDDSMGERLKLLGSLDFITRMNLMDLYVDTSQVEGWGLPLGEAMSCEIPVVMPDDYHVRNEVFGSGVYTYSSTPLDTWDTWHVGSRLVGIDTNEIVNAILDMKNDDSLRNDIASIGKTVIDKLKWEDTRKQMVEVLKNV